MSCKYDCFIAWRAEQDLDDIMQYIAETLSNPSAARSLSARIFDNIEYLGDFPHMELRWRTAIYLIKVSVV